MKTLHMVVFCVSRHTSLLKRYTIPIYLCLVFYGLLTFSWVTTKDFKKLRDNKNEGAILSSSGNYKALFYKMSISKVKYYIVFLVLPLVFIPLAWHWVLAGFLIMHFTSGLILSTIFQTAHVVPTPEYPVPDNNNEMDNNWAVHQLYTASDFAPGSKLF